MSDLDDLEAIADVTRPARTRTPTPGLAKAGKRYWKLLSRTAGKSINSRVRSSRANRKVKITLASTAGT